jgi:two-component system response regulator YesN
VLIVEDERMTRETLRTLVPWARLGVDEVETARDGVEALEKAARRTPDLVLCDIRMPRMGGIELAEQLRDRNPECGIIFLSGYSDKAYLKAAIRLKAADYIDKPLNLEEISAAVERNVRALRARADTSAAAERARRVLTDLEPLLRAELAEALCGPGADLAALRAKHEARLAAPFLRGPLRVAVAEVELAAEGLASETRLREPLSETRPREPLSEARLREVVRALNEATSPDAPAAWLAGPDRIGLLAAGEELCAEARFEALLDGVAGVLERRLPEARVRFGLGPAVAAPPAGPSCAAALEALGASFYDPDQRFLRPPDGPPAAPPAESPALDGGLEAQVRSALRAGDLEGAAAALRELEGRARRERPPRTAMVGEAYERVLRAVLEEAPGFGPGEARAEQERMHGILLRQRTLAGLAAVAEATLRRCFAPGSGGAAVDRRIARIKEYIRAHHADPELLVEGVAAGVGLSESYLCTLFKQACGVTVKDHLTQVRIDRAKQLLRDTTDKLQAVALEVGFCDANYFSTVFKREVGITPREYRERSQR